MKRILVEAGVGSGYDQDPFIPFGVVFVLTVLGRCRQDKPERPQNIEDLCRLVG